MRLGELIERLEAFPHQDAIVRFSDGRKPYEFHSWRGDYAQLTLSEGYGNIETFDGVPSPKWPVTVGELLIKATRAVGAKFQGWKGGDFTMSVDSPVWADEPGCCDCYAIVGWRTGDDGTMVLEIMEIGEYR